jgi:3',5'-cyclic AMP phosphodiesterase CpdA
VPTRILHVSDLHVGAQDEDFPEGALSRLADRLQPALVIASGDLTHRGRRDQHERAATLLRSLGRPVLAVPGNHDIPYTFPARFAAPWLEFERVWETTEPTFAGDGLHVVGVNSVRPWRHQSGAVDDRRLQSAAERLRSAAPGVFRVAVLHHQLIGAPWRTRKRPVARRGRVLAGLIDAGAELILGGHIHQAAVSERHEFEVTGGAPGGVISIAPGFGQPRPQRRGEARGALAYTVEGATMTAETFIWQDDDWGLTAVRRFPRGGEPPVEPD